MPVTYRLAPEVRNIAVRLMDTDHTRLQDEDVRCWFRSDARRSQGRDIWGDAKKISGLNAAMVRAAEGVDSTLPGETDEDLLNAPMFVLVVPEDIWKIVEDDTKEALVFDLLCRCRVEGSEEGPRLTLAGPDLVEFVDTVQKYGLWRDSVRNAARAMFKAQPTLFDKATLDALTDEHTPDHNDAQVTTLPRDGRWAVTCDQCGEITDDDVSQIAEQAAVEHRAWHDTRATVEAGAEDDVDGDEGPFGEAFDSRLDEIDEQQADRERHLQAVRS